MAPPPACCICERPAQLHHDWRDRWTVACVHGGTCQMAAALTRAFGAAHAAGWPNGQRFLVDLSQLTRTAREPRYLTKDSWLALVLETRGVWSG